MEVDNNKPEEDIRKPIDSSQLFYKDVINKCKSVSRITNTFSANGKQYKSNIALALKNVSQPQGRVSDINSSNSSQLLTLNIQLLYDVNQVMGQDSWDSNFHPIPLHGLIGYLPYNIKNIKTSLNWMSKYILNKSVERGKVNDFDDLKGVSKVAWDFILAIYDSGWNVLSIDNNVSFRNKVASKFTPKINNNNNLKNKGSKSDNKLATVSRLPLPIPAKLPKVVKNIAKFFKKNEKSKEKETPRKSYTQASLLDNNTREVLKIKEAFSNLQEIKIENIQKIINGGNKPKPKLNMTTKRLSCKQVIVPMNSDNIVNFMSNSSNHITNINRFLKNIKSDCKADYIWLEKSGIIIVTEKIVFTLDL